jgi:hypothetical protein
MSVGQDVGTWNFHPAGGNLNGGADLENGKEAPQKVTESPHGPAIHSSAHTHGSQKCLSTEEVEPKCSQQHNS